MKFAQTIYHQARSFDLGRFVTILLLAVAAAGLPGCDEDVPPARARSLTPPLQVDDGVPDSGVVR
jgi:hypothetical protein